MRDTRYVIPQILRESWVMRDSRYRNVILARPHDVNQCAGKTAENNFVHGIENQLPPSQCKTPKTNGTI
jgi:hypothetical protein